MSWPEGGSLRSRHCCCVLNTSWGLHGFNDFSHTRRRLPRLGGSFGTQWHAKHCSFRREDSIELRATNGQNNKDYGSG